MVSAISGVGALAPRLEAAAVPAPSGISPAANAGFGATDFGAVLSQVAGDAVKTVRGAEAASIQGIKGEASTQAVVEAVMAAERTLQTAVALREKVTNAYLELSRLSI